MKIITSNKQAHLPLLIVAVWILLTGATGSLANDNIAKNNIATNNNSAGSAEAIAKGKALAFDRKKGNCLACHAIDDGTLAGNRGPAIIAMKTRFPDREVLRSQIWDATKKNPASIMPPFGEHRILSSEEIDLIINYLYTL